MTPLYCAAAVAARSRTAEKILNLATAVFVCVALLKAAAAR